ncbi:MAG: hypothetical protein AAGF26_20020, partial [Cyanobacteria bacterium P01_G01_bin.49]
VDSFLEMELQIDTQPPEKLPAQTTIIDVYDREDIKSQLLILGELGYGKSVTLLKLAQILVERAQKDVTKPVPIILIVQTISIRA